MVLKETSMSPTFLDKDECGQIVNEVRRLHGLTWSALAQAINQPLVWTVAAVLGKHPLPAASAEIICEKLGLDDACLHALQRRPGQMRDQSVGADPIIRCMHEAIDAHGLALKELIREEYGEGIVSAINLDVTFSKRTDVHSDRVAVTIDGKFLRQSH